MSVVVDKLLPQVVAGLEDDFEQTRLVMCQVLEKILVVFSLNFKGSDPAFDRLHQVYPQLLKRLDDNDDAIR